MAIQRIDMGLAYATRRALGTAPVIVIRAVWFREAIAMGRVLSVVLIVDEPLQTLTGEQTPTRTCLCASLKRSQQAGSSRHFLHRFECLGLARDARSGVDPIGPAPADGEVE